MYFQEERVAIPQHSREPLLLQEELFQVDRSIDSGSECLHTPHLCTLHYLVSSAPRSFLIHPVSASSSDSGKWQIYAVGLLEGRRANSQKVLRTSLAQRWSSTYASCLITVNSNSKDRVRIQAEGAWKLTHSCSLGKTAFLQPDQRQLQGKPF